MAATPSHRDTASNTRIERASHALQLARRLVLRASDERAMLNAVCHILVDVGACTTAWVGRVDAAGDALQPTARAGHGGVLATLDSRSTAPVWGKGPTARAVRTVQTVVVRDIARADEPYPEIFRTDARQHGVSAICALPLAVGNRLLGALTLLDAHAGAFDTAEIGHLRELADDVSVAMRALRERADAQREAHRLRLLDRALRTLSAGNRALVHCTEEGQLLAEMCRRIVAVGGYRVAWIGYAQHDDACSIFPMAQEGLPYGALDEVPITWADTPAGQVPAGVVIRTGKPCVRLAVDSDPLLRPYRGLAHKLGVTAVSAFPLKLDGEVIGNVNIAACEPDAFGDEELAVLAELAEDLAFGISNLRMRARHRQAERTIERMAFVDPLTGLPNRTRLHDRLDREIGHARQHHQAVALLTINVDRFRDINDVLGYRQGDALLVALAGRLKDALAPPGIVARVGVDEFAVLLPGAGAEAAEALARAIARGFDEPFELDGARIEVLVSIGIALFPGHGADAESLLMRSDAAMYQAKRERSGIAVFRGDSEHENRERLTLMAELRRAIADNQLRLYCQPKVDMSNGRVCGAEALVRWMHPDRGVILPDAFIPLAERTGLINPLTTWVLNSALGQCYAWREEGIELPLAVNLSARNLLDPRLLERLSGLFVTWGAKPEWLQFELTESALMEDPAGALDVLRRLHDIGFRLYVDDFGTGYSSLSYLRMLPIDAVKIDKSFVLGMQTDRDSGIIVRSTIEMVHNIGLEVVAEGTANRSLWEQLAAFGSDVAQGSYISDPIPTEDLARWNAGFVLPTPGIH